MADYYVLIGGKQHAVKAPSAMEALEAALQTWTEHEFEDLSEKTESGRITVSVLRLD